MIIFTNHVKIRMIERKITKNMVEQTINNPDNTFKDLGNKMIAQKEFAHKTLEVIYTIGKGNKIILTCYYL